MHDSVYHISKSARLNKQYFKHICWMCNVYADSIALYIAFFRAQTCLHRRKSYEWHWDFSIFSSLLFVSIFKSHFKTRLLNLFLSILISNMILGSVHWQFQHAVVRAGWIMEEMAAYGNIAMSFTIHQEVWGFSRLLDFFFFRSTCKLGLIVLKVGQGVGAI